MTKAEIVTGTLKQPDKNYMVSFHKDNQLVGAFDFKEGAMHFEGDVTESGKIFVEYVLGYFQERIDIAVADAMLKAHREPLTEGQIREIAFDTRYGGLVETCRAIEAALSKPLTT